MKHGLILGKFLPPHAGHLYMIDFARHYADRLTVVVGSLPDEPIPGELRWRWMQELVPQARVVHLTDENPQYPHEHPDFWDIWRHSLQTLVGEPVDLLFASEEYGQRLAQELGASFLPTPGARGLFPVSGTAIRQAPLLHWEWIPAPVRAYYARRICLFGPESCGKSTLAQRLAEHYRTLWVPEYARSWLEPRQGRVVPPDMLVVAQAQAAAEDAMARQANRWLFCDTDPLTTQLWSQELFGDCPEEVRRWARGRNYALTLLLSPDVPWVSDPVRYRPQERERFARQCRELLEREGRPYVELSGSWEERWQQALAALADL